MVPLIFNRPATFKKLAPNILTSESTKMKKRLLWLKNNSKRKYFAMSFVNIQVLTDLHRFCT